MSLPLSEATAKKCYKWMLDNLEAQIIEYIYGTPYTVKLVCAIALQETACKWHLWIDNYTPEMILQRCVFDASGDFPGTTREAFPQNKLAFQQRYGKSITDMLVHEANLTRAMPQPGYPQGYSKADYLYKGYGLFQYDLQNIKTDPEFFLQRKWYNFSDCMQKLIEILNEKTKKDYANIIEAYNGSGTKAKQYAKNVREFMDMVS